MQTLRERVDEARIQAIKEAVAATRTRTEAAKLLGISLRTFYYLQRNLKISLPPKEPAPTPQTPIAATIVEAGILAEAAGVYDEIATHMLGNASFQKAS